MQAKPCNVELGEMLWAAAVSEQETRELESRATRDPAGPMQAVGEAERDEHDKKLRWSGDDESGKKKVLPWGIEQKGKSEEQCQNRSHVKLSPQKVL